MTCVTIINVIHHFGALAEKGIFNLENSSFDISHPPVWQSSADLAANFKLTNQKATGGGGIIQASAVPVQCKKMAKTPTTLDKLVRILKVETIFIYSSKLKGKATVVFRMFKFINKLV